MNILFICRYNRFRSRVAEAYFNKVNKNKKIRVKSAGLIKGKPLDKDELKIAKKFNLNINGKPKGLDYKILDWYDTAIIVANNVQSKGIDKIRKNQKVIVWKINDVPDDERDEKIISKMVEKIIKKVDDLADRLEKEK